MPYAERIYKYNTSAPKMGPRFIDFSFLQWLITVHLQYGLGNAWCAMIANGTAPEDMDRLGDTLHRYYE